MTRTEFENKTFEEVMEQLTGEKDDITTYEQLKEFVVSKIEEDDLFVAIHILEAINNDSAEWYVYDYCMGTLQAPFSVTCKEDIEEYIFDN